MTVMVKENVCVGCGRCVSFCPRGALSVWGILSVDVQCCTDCFGGMHYIEENAPLADRKATMDQQKSWWTRNCIPNCPVYAIEVRPD
jgi:ferredoxin